MANIQERVNSKGQTVYRVQVRLRGAPPETATFARITDAKKWAQKTEADIRAGRHFKNAEAKRHTAAEMIDRYVRDVLPKKGAWSLNAQSCQLKWWKEQLGAYALADVTPAMIAGKRDELVATPVKRGKKETPRSAATVNRYMAVLSHCFTMAVKEWGWLDD
ncbi:MAG TPA: site-specific integrase, partial [Candidatus Hydrogenedentes bacterium]|nr:site-specific integrase [Candidatus Hydrogenedentota bacterium]